MTRPTSNADDLQRGIGEQDDQEFLDQINVGEAGVSGVLAEERMEMEEHDRQAIDLLEGLRAMQTGDPIRWHIDRTGHEDASMNGFLAEWTTSQLTQSRLRDHFGGGRYRIRGYYSNGRYAAQRTVQIAGDAKMEPKPGPNVNTNGPPFNLTEFLAQQEARDAARRREEDARAERARKERNELIAVIAPLVAPALANLVGGNRGPDVMALVAAMKPADPVETIMRLRELSKPAESVDPMDRAFKVLDFVTEKVGIKTGDGETSMISVLKELVKVVGPSVGGIIETAVQRAQTQAAAPQQTGQPSAPQLNGPTSAANGGSASPTAANGINLEGVTDVNILQLAPHLPWFQAQLSRMVEAAARDSDPDLYAALLLEELPAGLDAPAIGALIARADWFERFQQFDARVAPHGSWFASLRGCVLRFIAEAQAAQQGAGGVQSPVGAGTVVQPGPVPVTAAVRSPPSAPKPFERPAGPPTLTGEVVAGE